MSGMLLAVVDAVARPKSGEGMKSGPIGLAVILVLCVVAYFLFKSMSKHLRNVREDFPGDKRYAKDPSGDRGSGSSDATPGSPTPGSSTEASATVPPDDPSRNASP